MELRTRTYYGMHHRNQPSRNNTTSRHPSSAPREYLPPPPTARLRRDIPGPRTLPNAIGIRNQLEIGALAQRGQICTKMGTIFRRQHQEKCSAKPPQVRQKERTRKNGATKQKHRDGSKPTNNSNAQRQGKETTNSQSWPPAQQWEQG